MSKANQEQLLAIEHQGGVLLKAGAGSGKTFVLVEHIIYQSRIWIDSYNSRQGTFEEYIRGKFSQIVMMTFTKKAAGEMSIRLSDRFLQASEEAGERQEYWKMCLEALPLLTVTTIDGFCRRLITSGFFPHLSTEAKIIFNTERLDQVRLLFERWFEEESGSIPKDILDIVIREKKNLLSALSSVFSDPGLRLAWKEFDVAQTRPENLGQILNHSFLLNGLEHSLASIQNLDLPAESDRSTFEKIVGQFQATGLAAVDSVDKLLIYHSLFEPIKQLRGESGKKKSPLHDHAKEGLADLRDWVRKWATVIVDYSENYEAKVLPWMKLCHELFIKLEKRLDPNQGMTFGDIEYYVALGLRNKEVREQIGKQYRYFIVDEFQDTSALQFQIIRDLISADYGRLFCVGDAKQAIYGFRGGELSVFQDCSDLIPQIRNLANNYRSLPAVIDFNNTLFRTLLPMGQNYEGLDPFSVLPEDQNVPAEVNHQENGEVESLLLNVEYNVEEEGKLSTEQVNHLEARILADAVERQRKLKPLETCTILYRKLKPSGELIRALIQKKIGFTAQFKTDLLDDPIMGMFLVLLKRHFDSNEKTKDTYPLLILKSYLSILQVGSSFEASDFIRFDQDLKYWGLLEAFKKFIYRLNITNENADINFEVIETLSNLYHQDPESILVQLTMGENQRLSLDFRFGKDSGKVQIMTAHASKGLEFDTVYLAGIYTNGREMPDREMFGDRPGSFYWYLDLSQRIKQKSPQYLFESELNKYKNFSESKRLFYVATTRAKKKLAWIDFQGIDQIFSVPKNSWIDGIKAWSEKEVRNNVKVTKLEHFNFDQLLKEKSYPELPLFFHDPVGIYNRSSGSRSELLITAELSVTRLNSLVDCPRKFYLENTLKLAPTSEPVLLRSWASEEGGEVIKSSAERGTQIHELIAEGITQDFIYNSEEEHAKPIQWVLGHLKEASTSYNFISEKSLKFKFFGFMISGIPDLVLIPKKDGPAQIWDYKTGRVTPEALSHYWVQLYAYAYALYELGQLSIDTKTELKLCFVDEEKFLEKKVDFKTVRQSLFNLWGRQNEPWNIKTDHCAQCSYGDICPR